MFVTTTSDAPGTNRFEIDLDKGQLVCDGKKLIKRELSMSIPEFHKTYKGGFGSPEVTETEVETDGENLQHVGVHQQDSGSRRADCRRRGGRERPDHL